MNSRIKFLMTHSMRRIASSGFIPLTHLKHLLIFGLFCVLFTTSCSDSDDEIVSVPPEVSAISPSSGPKTTVVTITGANFSTTIGDNVVTFNGRPAKITAATPTQITVEVPAAADSGPVVVTTGENTATNQPAFAFEWMVSTVAGSTAGYVDGSAGKFYSPSGVAADSLGNLYISDFGNHMIRKINASGMVSTLSGSDAGVVDGLAATAKFYFPNGLAIDKQGNVYISEEGSSRVRKISISGEVTTVAGGTPGFADGAGIAAKFNTPSGIAIDQHGTLYIADQFNHSIRKITPAGIVTTLAGGTVGATDGTGAAAQFQRPTGVVADEEGNVFVADLFNHRIRKITASGVVTTLAGSSYGFADGTGTAAKFAYPAGLALDKQGNLYVADTENNRVRKITPAGVVSTFAGIGAQGAVDGVAAIAQFYAPREIDIDSNGNVYVADAGNHRIRKVD